jgi:AcrR family transcriptional regulator
VSPERARSRRGEGDRLREEIVEAATELLLKTDDAEAVTIRAVAKAVGVTPPSIYLHFADKTSLIVAVCQATFDVLDEHIEQAAAGIVDPLEAIVVRGRAYIEFGLDNPENYRILFMTRKFVEELPPEELLRSAAFDHHHAAVLRAHEAGLLREGLDPLVAAIGLWSAVHGITSLLITKPNFPWPDREQLLEHVLDCGVRAISR